MPEITLLGVFANANGCTLSTAFSVVSPTALVMGVPIVNDVLCFNGNDGNLTATASGGAGNILIRCNLWASPTIRVCLFLLPLATIP